ncbi:MAG TPA: alpha-L-arabinofuranosidase C-terminal domain-containing protein, partial [Fimbriimonadaceae bacterium]|nr:alpha-L-arabinofuranosidase C-terminal domain-containing protein [Fimbriimonadaceae bacterium]
IGCAYDLADGLGIAMGLHEFFRQSDLVTFAAYAQTVNVIGAIKTSRTAAEIESTGLVLEMYRRHFGTTPIRLDHDFPPYDIAAALTDDGNALTVGLVNPTPEPLTLQIEFSDGDLGTMTRYLLTGPEPSSANAPGTPRQVDIAETSGLDPAAGLALPPYACGIFVIDQARRAERS